MKTKVTGVALMLSLSVFTNNQEARADEKQHDFYFQQNQQRFINQPLDARMLGMSGSTALTASSALSAAQNPAGLGLMPYGDLSVSYAYNEVSGNQYPQGGKVKDKQNSGQVFGATPINPVRNGLPDGGNLGFGWWGRGGDWTHDVDNTDTSTYQITGAYAKALTESTSIGYGLTYQRDSVDATSHEYTSSESFLHTLGIQHKFSDDLKFGGILSIGHGDHDLDHLNDPRSSQNVKQMSYGIGTGLEYQIEQTALAFGADYTFYGNNGDDDPASNDYIFGGDSMGRVMNIRLGVEQGLFDWLAVRAGYRYASNFKWDYDREDLEELTGSAKFSAWTGGVGVRYDLQDQDYMLKSINLDYGVEYRDVGDNDWQHLISLSSPFDLCI